MRKSNKLKIYVLMLSKEFPKEHPRSHAFTFFEYALRLALENRKEWVVDTPYGTVLVNAPKLHTIRTNYERWEKRIKAIQEGKAELSIRQWKGRPYEKGNVQIEIARLSKNDGVGIQKLQWDQVLGWFIDDVDSDVTTAELAKNDGLCFDDWKAWFKDMDFSKPLPIIHFTKFRYGRQEG